jgi:hypothetical protein
MYGVVPTSRVALLLVVAFRRLATVGADDRSCLEEAAPNVGEIESVRLPESRICARAASSSVLSGVPRAVALPMHRGHSSSGTRFPAWPIW